MNRSTLPIVGALLVCLAWGGFDAAWSRADDADMSTWPPLPQADASVEIPAQEWPLRPGPRKIRVVVHYPSGRLENVGPRTGVMLTLHNWGGVDCVGTADPRTLATRLNVVALCVNYLQSGKEDSIDGPEPYDFGYLQALDALRALAWSCDRLRTVRPSFAEGRLFCTGGSGGGNVSLRAQKLAPRTFACVVDMCGMKKLSDDIAFNLAGGSDLNARYVRDSRHPYFLSIDHQELRFLGNREHLAVQQSYLPTARLVTVHGSQDTTCPYADAVEMAEAMKAERFDVETRFLTSADLDGKIFTSAGHSLGNRTEIVFAVAGKYLSESGKEARERRGPSDFQRREPIVYPTTNGRFVIDYSRGYPVGRFESKSPPPSYKSRTQLLDWIDDEGKPQPVRTQEEWRHRREHIVESFELVAGRRPSPMQRVPLDVRFGPPIRDRNVVRYAVTYQSDREDRVPAWLLVPPSLSDAWEKAKSADVKANEPKPSLPRTPAVLCLHQTTARGKDEPAGVAGDATMKYAYELAERGFVTLAPDYPSLGEHAYDFAPQHGYHSGTMKAVWDNVRAVDLLETLPFVDSQRIGVMGHSLGGHNAIFTALMDERLRVIVSSCGFSSFAKDDVPSWTGPRYLPRLAKQYGNEAACIPFDFPELIGALAPRPFLAVAATRDDDFDVSGVRDCLAAARPVYELHRAATRLQGLYPEAPHSFPDEARKQAYDFLQRELVDRQPVGRKLNHSGGPAVSELKRDEQVVVFPAVAAWNKETRQWQAPLRAWVFESRANGLRERALIELISTTLDLKDEQETRTLRERLAPFVADDEDGKRLVLKLEGNEFALPKTGDDGHAMVQVQWPDEEGPHRSRTRVKRVDVVMPDGDERGFFADVHCIPEQGVSVISDIDDTIKHSHVLDRKELLRNTFLRPFQAVPGMADRYRAWDARGDVAWHFVSASPWQLYGPLSDWAIAERFPPASFHLRTVRLGNVDLWKSLGESQDYKLTTIESLMKAFPKRQFVLVGDTGEKDPEVYGEIARRFPRQIIAIYLREVRPEPQDVSRFEAALRDVPPERWRIFREPSDLPSMIVP